MIKTCGLTHIALAVKNAKRSFEFYRNVFGVTKDPDDYEVEIAFEPPTPVDPRSQRS
jgi:predicted enzyme related to lactoylglutathione lyase